MSDITTRLGFPFPDGADGPDGPDVPYWMERLAVDLDDKVLGYDQGVLSSRPLAGVEGRMYYATDDGSLYYDTGTGWVPAAWQPGMVQWTAANPDRPPVGWLAADGSTISRATFAALFAAIGTVHGAGDGRTTFGLPDLRGRAPVGAGAGAGLTARPLGTTGGAETHLLTAAQSGIPDHEHHMTSVDMGGAPPALVTVGGKLVVRGDTAGGGSGVSLTQRTDGSFSFGIGVGGMVGGARNATQAHANMQPFLALNAWIKT